MMGRRKERKPMIYERPVDSSPKENAKHRTIKGYVPMLVGKEPTTIKKLFVHVMLFNEPCIAELLEMAVEELGHRQEGILRVFCDADHLRRMVDAISKAK